MGTRGEKTGREGVGQSGADAPPQTEREHPEEWGHDLRPDRTAGQNPATRSAEAEPGIRTAYDAEDLRRQLTDEFTVDELKSIPVIPEGQRLQQGGVYIDLNDPKRREFTATGDMSAGARNLYTSKAEVPYSIWNRLVGAGTPNRTARRRKAAG